MIDYTLTSPRDGIYIMKGLTTVKNFPYFCAEAEKVLFNFKPIDFTRNHDDKLPSDRFVFPIELIHDFSDSFFKKNKVDFAVTMISPFNMERGTFIVLSMSDGTKNRNVFCFEAY